MVYAKATSALEMKSRLAPRLVPIKLVNVNLVRTRSSLPIIGSVEVARSYSHWERGSSRLLIASFFLSVLVEFVGPAELSAQFFRMTVNLLNTEPNDRAIDALAMFLSRTMRVLGLMGAVENCAICGIPLVKGYVLSPGSLSSFFCVRCFNKGFGGRAVEIVKMRASTLNKVFQISRIPLLEYHRLKLKPDELGLLIGLFCARVGEFLPKSSRALTEFLPHLGVALPKPEGQVA